MIFAWRCGFWFDTSKQSTSTYVSRPITLFLRQSGQSGEAIYHHISSLFMMLHCNTVGNWELIGVKQSRWVAAPCCPHHGSRHLDWSFSPYPALSARLESSPAGGSAKLLDVSVRLILADPPSESFTFRAPFHFCPFLPGQSRAQWNEKNWAFLKWWYPKTMGFNTKLV